MVPPINSTAPTPRRAVVLGASLTGMLAATVLADHADEVIVVDRDNLPNGPVRRPGLPQARHVHMLWSGGARAIEALVPGLEERWLAAGARRVRMPADLLALTAHGWTRRSLHTQYQIACSRDLLDAVARKHTLGKPGITVRTRTHADSLIGDQHQVCGVRLRHLETGAVTDLEACLVVDATGRGSRAPQWLAQLDLPPVREEIVDPGLVYATRVFRAPAGGEDFPVVTFQADPRDGTPGRMATLAPIEGARWLVTLAGTRGAEPTAKPQEFEPFARQLRHPLVADLIANAEPLTDIHITRACSNRRRFYEQMRSWPSGFIVLGDAVAAYNPVYGQGMSVAAQGATILRDVIGRHGLQTINLTRHVQHAIGRLVQGPWDVTTGQDSQYPGAVGKQRPVTARLVHAYVVRLMRTANGRKAVTRALYDVMSLSAPSRRLFYPSVVLQVLLGPGQPPLTEPPLSPTERAHLSRS
ncbi:NAD(P)/FAD-dependent oxidoreductase [Streptomyces asiaticus]